MSATQESNEVSFRRQQFAKKMKQIVTATGYARVLNQGRKRDVSPELSQTVERLLAKIEETAVEAKDVLRRPGEGGHYSTAGDPTAASGASCREMPVRQVATPNGCI